MQLKVVPLAPEHLDRVCEMEEASFSMPWHRKDFEELIASEESEYFVLLADDRVCGCAGYTDTLGDAYINNVVIDGEYRGRGYGRELVSQMIEHGLKKGIKNYTLEVRVGNTAAVKLYEALGFESAGIRKNFYEKPVEDAYVMWLRK